MRYSAIFLQRGTSALVEAQLANVELETNFKCDLSKGDRVKFPSASREQLAEGIYALMIKNQQLEAQIQGVRDMAR